jgi:hypothetical protein
MVPVAGRRWKVYSTERLIKTDQVANELCGKINDLYINLFDNTVNNYNYIKFTNIDDIESYINDFIDERFIYDGLFISQAISSINESLIIKNIRKLYESKCIKFKTAVRVPVTIQTENYPIQISRYLLTPKTPEDAKRLMELEGVRGIFPLDIALGLNRLPHLMTVKGMLKVCQVALESRSYKQASEQLAKAHRINLKPSTVMAVTNHIGNLAFQYDMDRANETYNKIFGNGSSKFDFPKEKKDGLLYIEMDGAFVNTRDKSETKKSSWHENKLGLVFSSTDKRLVKRRKNDVESADVDSLIKRERYNLSSKEYTSYIGSVDIFKKLILDCAIRNGYGQYKETVLISDGATWIRNLKEEVFWDAQQILDYFHLSEKIANFGKIYFKIQTIPTSHNTHRIDDTAIKEHPNYLKYKSWHEDMCQKLLQSRHNEVLNDIINMEKSTKINNEKLSKYIINNQNSIDYATYIKKGYDIGSGAIESANKTVLKERLVGAGMRWHLESAQYVVTLMSKLKSNKWFEDVIIPVKRYYNIIK